MKITKNHLIGAILGAILCTLIYIGYVFYGEIQSINAIAYWKCQVDPASCGIKVAAPQAQSEPATQSAPTETKK